MTRRRELPRELQRAVFTREQLEKSGFHGTRVDAKDIIHTAVRGLYAHSSLEITEPSLLWTLQKLYPKAWVSHFSAARMHGLYTPKHPADVSVHLTTLLGEPRIRRGGITSYQSGHRDSVVRSNALWLSSPGRTVMELALLASLDELVVLIDQLVREPRPELENRWEPFVHLTDWKKMAADFHGRGAKKLRAATELARVGSDSPPETKLRLAIMRAGLPEPDLQIELPVRGWRRPSADLGYKELLIAVHYDGGAHREREQQQRDNWRDNAFSAEGWRNLHCNSRDLAGGFRETCARLERLIHEQRQRLGAELRRRPA